MYSLIKSPSAASYPTKNFVAGPKPWPKPSTLNPVLNPTLNPLPQAGP